MRQRQGFRFFDSPVRDQEVDGSNPFAPTIFLIPSFLCAELASTSLFLWQDRQHHHVDSRGIIAEFQVEQCAVGTGDAER